MQHLYLLLVIIMAGSWQLSAQSASSASAKVSKAIGFDQSKALRDIAPVEPGKILRTWKNKAVPNKVGMKKIVHQNGLPLHGEATAQHTMGARTTRNLVQNFEGVDNIYGYYPPDTQGDVGENYYLQITNVSFAVFDKTDGSVVYGPADNSTIWDGFTGPWTSTNDGDGIVLYDEVAERWLFSQFSLPNYPDGPFYELIAISQTDDPTGAWYRYAFAFDDMPDYPKFGIWPDGYYMAINQFSSGSLGWAGAGAVAFDRTAMLAGDPDAQMVYFDLAANSDPGSMLPSDMDGLTPPPAGTPNYFAYFNDDAFGYANDHMRIWEFDVDWENTANSTFTEAAILPTDPFDSDLCSAPRDQCIPQMGTAVQLESLAGRLMYRLQYRNFGTHQSMVVNHTVDEDGNGHAGIRWYEFRDTNNGNGWSIYQQGTYAPDADYRWMGSIAMDGQGNIALGYSVSSSQMYPSIRYTGRLASDPLGEMTFTEQEIIAGTGNQTGSAARWGDYSMMSVDPTDDATFWYTTEYIQTSGAANWQTRIASFAFASQMSATASATPAQICLGNTSQLAVQVVNGSGNYTYTWSSDPAGFTSVLANPVVSPQQTTTYTVEVDDGANTVSTEVVVTVFDPPTVQAGDDATVCGGSSYQLNGGAQNSASTLWTSAGDGTFDDALLLNATYSPGTNDLNNGQTTLTLTAYGQGDCADIGDSMELLFLEGPTVIAGADGQVCEGTAYPLSGQVEDAISYSWSTSGDGAFDDNGDLNTNYTPGTNDLQAGTVTLTLTATGTPPCEEVSDDLILQVDYQPVVDAGEDMTGCGGALVALQASATHYASLLWSTAGDGSFNDPTSPQSNYTPGANDLSTGSVVLSLTVEGLGACTAITDELLLTILPQPLVSAGGDTVICDYENLQLNGVVGNVLSAWWTSAGDGYFDDANVLNTIYYPGELDVLQGSVLLTLNSQVQAPCQSLIDELLLTLDPCLGTHQNPASEDWLLTLLPNPSNGRFILQLSGAQARVEVGLYNYQGNCVLKQEMSPKAAQYKVFELSHLPKGMYLLRFTSGKEKVTRRLIFD